MKENASVDENKTQGWAKSEFGECQFGDKRLTKRLIKIADSLANLPESSINQVCKNWSEAKAAYRFFENDKVDVPKILAVHCKKTAQRASSCKKVLVIQDTTYISYLTHPQTTDLGIISKKGAKYKNKESKGLIMHTAFAVSTEGLPLGITDQKIYARPPVPEEAKRYKNKSDYNNTIPIEEKESRKWLESLKKTNSLFKCKENEVITVCDREADIYDFFKLANELKAPVLVRGSNRNRVVNKKSRYSEKGKEKLGEVVESFPCQGEIQVEVPAKDNKPKRIATLEVSYGMFTMNIPINNIGDKKEKQQSFPVYAVYVVEKNPPEKTEPLEWILLTNLEISNYDEALEKVRWYCLRWKIEVFHKILKSGLKVEECRLQTAAKLIRYLTIMSIIGWRIFYITLIARAKPDLPCNIILKEEEWQILYIQKYKTKPNRNTKVPSIREVILWIAELGGHMGRKKDLEPGPIVIWRGWKRLFDLINGWKLAQVS
jgi:hypothetical protein